MTKQPANYFLALLVFALLPAGVLIIAQMAQRFKVPEDVLVTATFFTFFAVFLAINTYSYRQQLRTGRALGKLGIYWHFWLTLIGMALILFAAHLVAPAVKARGFAITLTFIGTGFFFFIAGQIVFLVNWWISKPKQMQY